MTSTDNPLLQAQALYIQFADQLSQAPNEAAIEAIRVQYWGRKGLLTQLMRMIASMNLEEKRIIAPELQKIQRTCEEAIVARSNDLARKTDDRSPRIDVTSSIRTVPAGGLHPYTLIVERIESLFMGLGWNVVEGPEVEDEFHNFEALNIPKFHPARDDHDTFWLTVPGHLLRTHTSSVQIRTLLSEQPPIAICAPGRVFRHEATDATHDAVFMQCEGLYIDRSVSVTHLIGTLTLFMKHLFHRDDLSIRLRPSFFPFVRPGLEIDISCIFCAQGCPICKYTHWIEIGGAGMVHPHVLRSCMLDPNTWSGFAFGFGIERLAMLLYHITDVRLFKTTKLTILEQFSEPRGDTVFPRVKSSVH